jgi:hypothetical protein
MDYVGGATTVSANLMLLEHVMMAYVKELPAMKQGTGLLFDLAVPRRSSIPALCAVRHMGLEMLIANG